jgi:hypothetical protein
MATFQRKSGHIGLGRIGSVSEAGMKALSQGAYWKAVLHHCKERNMDELHEISEELRRAIEELHNDNPQLRDFWLCVAGSMEDRMRRKAAHQQDRSGWPKRGSYG